MLDFEELDYYELLGVSRSASAEDIKRAYRREISKYHPDRFVTASADEQTYAERRSQSLSQANRVLSDFASRTAYNRNLPPTSQQRAATAIPNTRQRVDDLRAQPRDQQAELYDQARVHLEQGRVPQAVTALRQLQRINPFYRDSADLLAHYEAQLPQRRVAVRGRPLVIGGGVAGVAVIALAAWGLSRRGEPPTGTVAPTQVITVANVSATSAPSPVRSPIPTSAPEPTEEAATDIPAPIEEAATAVPTPAMTAVPPTIVAISENGPLVLADTFSNGGWADVSGNGWSVGYQDGQYRIAAFPGSGNIWSYRSGVPASASIGVDIRVLSGTGGMLLYFTDAQNYLSFTIDGQGSYRLEQHSGGVITVPASGQSNALVTGASATNRIVARLRGASVQLLANGQVLATVDALDVPASRRYGLLAVGGATASELRFDNVEIHALTQ